MDHRTCRATPLVEEVAVGDEEVVEMASSSGNPWNPVRPEGVDHPSRGRPVTRQPLADARRIGEVGGGVGCDHEQRGPSTAAARQLSGDLPQNGHLTGVLRRQQLAVHDAGAQMGEFIDGTPSLSLCADVENIDHRGGRSFS